tara:strand:- start:375 stop:548 length:174 start_codon:yes stop_codon:yes gene_type:complete
MVKPDALVVTPPLPSSVKVPEVVIAVVEVVPSDNAILVTVPDPPPPPLEFPPLINGI